MNLGCFIAFHRLPFCDDATLGPPLLHETRTLRDEEDSTGVIAEILAGMGMIAEQVNDELSKLSGGQAPRPVLAEAVLNHLEGRQDPLFDTVVGTRVFAAEWDVGSRPSQGTSSGGLVRPSGAGTRLNQGNLRGSRCCRRRRRDGSDQQRRTGALGRYD
jgi:hypothetical protein